LISKYKSSTTSPVLSTISLDPIEDGLISFHSNQSYLTSQIPQDLLKVGFISTSTSFDHTTTSSSSHLSQQHPSTISPASKIEMEVESFNQTMERDHLDQPATNKVKIKNKTTEFHN